jgi:iron complex transport system substrate-binding protein
LGAWLAWACLAATATISAAQPSPPAAPPQRIVSLVPSLTETVCALGACARLVGTDRWSNWPAAVQALPKLGGLEDAQLERIVALRPDLVLAAPSARLVERLRALGLNVQVYASDSHGDVRHSVESLAALLGDAPAGARVWQAVQRDLARAREQVPAAWRGRRVYFEIASTPFAAGPTSFIGETIVQLGLANIVPAALGPFPQLSPEFIVRAQPDVVMAPQREIAAMAARPGWVALAALGRGHVCGFDVERYEMLVRPGPRLGEAALALAGCLVALEAAR